MPKTRRDRSVSCESPRTSPVPCSSSMTSKSKAECPPSDEDLKEWDGTRCPVCMEHPHNAVLLVCSAYDKGCHPYMCDTSYRHSNCLDQFCKSFEEKKLEMPSQGGAEAPLLALETMVTPPEEGKSQVPVTSFSDMHKLQKNLVCPLCRGQISGWVVVESARDFMNTKTRNCACESCEYDGNYTDLRKHARSEHPQARPSEVDPERQRTWRRLERQRDIGDVLSTIQSTLGADQDVLPFDEYGRITFILVFHILLSGFRIIGWSVTSRSRTRIYPRLRSDSHGLESYDTEIVSVTFEIVDSSDDDSRRPRTRRRYSPPDAEEY